MNRKINYKKNKQQTPKDAPDMAPPLNNWNLSKISYVVYDYLTPLYLYHSSFVSHYNLLSVYTSLF